MLDESGHPLQLELGNWPTHTGLDINAAYRSLYITTGHERDGHAHPGNVVWRWSLDAITHDLFFYQGALKTHQMDRRIGISSESFESLE
jgi:hypothetical protein